MPCHGRGAEPRGQPALGCPPRRGAAPRPPAQLAGLTIRREPRTRALGRTTLRGIGDWLPLVTSLVFPGITGAFRKQGISSPRPRGRSTSGTPQPVQGLLLPPAEVAELKAESDQVLARLPADAKDPAIIPHIIAEVSETPVLFYEDDNEARSTPCSSALVHFRSPLPPWQLELSDVPSGCNAQSISEVLSDSALKAAFEQDVRPRIAASLNVDPSRICITDVRKGSVVVEYTVADLTSDEKATMLSLVAALDEKFKDNFDTFLSSKIPLAAIALKFNVADFDSRGTRNTWEGAEFEVGPPGKTRRYKQPSGWARYGLKVLGQFPDDEWLAPFQHDSNWYRAFHGIKDPKRSATAIFKEGFIPSGDARHGHAGTRTAHGDGVYVSPDVAAAEDYCKPVPVPTLQGTKNFEIAFQVAVKPGSAKEATERIWVVQHPDDVRPYGLLVKEA